MGISRGAPSGMALLRTHTLMSHPHGMLAAGKFGSQTFILSCVVVMESERVDRHAASHVLASPNQISGPTHRAIGLS